MHNDKIPLSDGGVLYLTATTIGSPGIDINPLRNGVPTSSASLSTPVDATAALGGLLDAMRHMGWLEPEEEAAAARLLVGMAARLGVEAEDEDEG
jgi:hypothetical protein